MEVRITENIKPSIAGVAEVKWFKAITEDGNFKGDLHIRGRCGRDINGIIKTDGLKIILVRDCSNDEILKLAESLMLHPMIFSPEEHVPLEDCPECDGYLKDGHCKRCGFIRGQEDDDIN